MSDCHVILKAGLCDLIYCIFNMFDIQCNICMFLYRLQVIGYQLSLMFVVNLVSPLYLLAISLIVWKQKVIE